MFAAFVCVLGGEVMSERAGNAIFLEQFGGLVSICAALGAIFPLPRAQEISDSERRLGDLGDLGDLVSADHAHDLVSALRRKDRLDQLTLVFSAVGSALQAFADAALDVGKAVVGVFPHLGH